MSAPELTDRERLAAEHAMRLLEGEELLQARGLMASDPGFADEVAEWEEKLSHFQAGHQALTFIKALVIRDSLQLLVLRCVLLNELLATLILIDRTQFRHWT